MLNIPSSDSLVAAIEAARAGSMAAAAEQLGITHGAVSRRIQSLEQWLGAPVFERRGRGVVPTSQGLIFLRRAERSLSAIEALRSELSSNRDRSAIRMSALPSMVRLWLMPRLRDLETSTGGRPIEILSEYRLAEVQNRDMEIAIRYGMGSWPGVEAHLLFPDIVVPAAAPALAAELAGASIDALMRQTQLIDGDGANWQRWSRFAGAPRVGVGLKRQFLDHDVAVEAARQGLGIILLRAPMAAEALYDRSLDALPFPGIEGSRGHYLVVRSGESRHDVLALADAIRAMGAESLMRFRDSFPNIVELLSGSGHVAVGGMMEPLSASRIST